MSQATKQSMMPYIHAAIGIGIMALFWFVLDPVMTVTPIGMRVAGVFLGMVYLWSTVGSIWPSILGIILLGLSGVAGEEFEGYAGVKAVCMQAFGSDTVVLIMLAMVLFGAIEYVGATKYIARWFVTRKIINGRPYVFMFMFYLACFILSAMTSPVISLLIVWNIGMDMLSSFGVKKGDKLWTTFNFGVFLSSTLGQPMLPFKGAILVVLGAYEKATGITIDMLSWILVNFSMGMVIVLIYLAFIRFVIRVDISSIKNINTDYFTQHPLPAMTKQQKYVIISLFVFIVLVLLPGFLPKTLPGIGLLARLGVIGVTGFVIVALMILRVDGKPVLPFQQAASSQFNWGVLFLIISAVYAGNALSQDNTGIKPFLVTVLEPVLGNQSEFGFMFIMFAVALVITNFANNAAMAVVLMPVILGFSEKLGLNSEPLMVGVGMLVFVAMLTPAASPHAGMMHGNKDLLAAKQIYAYGFPMCFVALLVYAFIGYPLAKFLFLG
ncbi:SLC13 family permease [Peptococcus simiae]|uniref:SLC13 family permease n=1 Tax=Peptococcus simiae TaxID=1643805 RepID=UPI003980EE5B